MKIFNKIISFLFSSKDIENINSFEGKDLFIGAIIDDGAIKCKVMQVHKTNFHVKIIEINSPGFRTYLDIGKIYPLFKHDHFCNDGEMELWEISGKRMKRDYSQCLLYWWKDGGWSWELDS